MIHNTNSEISFYVDTMIVETLLLDGSLRKTAQVGDVVAQLIEKVKNYFGNHVDPNDRAGSILNMLAPGALLTIFKALGFGWLGALLGLATSIFHIDVNAILGSIWSKLKSAVGGGKQTTSEEIDNMVSSSVQENVKPATEAEAEQAAAEAEKNKSASQLLRDAQLLKLAVVDFENNRMHKTAAPSSFWSMFNSRKSTTVNLLTKVLSWIFKIAIASAGLLVVGDVINKFLGRPNALDGSIQNGKPIASSTQAAVPAPPVHVSKQTKFKVKPTYVDEKRNSGTNWMESISNDEVSISSMLIQFAKDVYAGLDGKESVIRTSPAFDVIKDRIVTYNRASAGDAMVFLPKYFTSKKQIVDLFIDDVAESVP